MNSQSKIMRFKIILNVYYQNLTRSHWEIIMNSVVKFRNLIGPFKIIISIYFDVKRIGVNSFELWRIWIYILHENFRQFCGVFLKRENLIICTMIRLNIKNNAKNFYKSWINIFVKFSWHFEIKARYFSWFRTLYNILYLLMCRHIV